MKIFGNLSKVIKSVTILTMVLILDGYLENVRKHEEKKNKKRKSICLCSRSDKFP